MAVVAGEYLRMIGLLGVPFGSLAGACREQTWMLQVCDLGGIYTLSFPIAMVQGLIADFFLRHHYPKVSGKKKHLPLATLTAVWIAVATYGQVRPAQIEAGMKEGPRVAVIQPDVVYVLNSVQSYDPHLLLSRLKQLSEQATQAGDPPELFVWPEGISSFPLRNRELIEAPAVPEFERRKMARYENEFSKWAGSLKAPLIVGMDVVLPTEDQSFRYYNAAQIYDPDKGQSTKRQFKMRLYPGGEYFPWAGTWIDQALSEKKVLPSIFGIKDTYEPGTKREVFRVAQSRYAISTCSEILSPVSSGVFLLSSDEKKPFDFLINIANEGTFLRNEAQIHQFAYLPFRAIEARVGIARSSNTGISGFVSPTGKVYSLITNQDGQARTGLGAPELPLINELISYRQENEKDFATDLNKRTELNRRIAEVQNLREKAGIEGFSVDRVYTYPKMTIYQRFGDWLAVSTLIGLCLMWVSPKIFPKK